jgi:hypothetical protein
MPARKRARPVSGSATSTGSSRSGSPSIQLPSPFCFSEGQIPQLLDALFLVRLPQPANRRGPVRRGLHASDRFRARVAQFLRALEDVVPCLFQNPVCLSCSFPYLFVLSRILARSSEALCVTSFPRSSQNAHTDKAVETCPGQYRHAMSHRPRTGEMAHEIRNNGEREQEMDQDIAT